MVLYCYVFPESSWIIGLILSKIWHEQRMRFHLQKFSWCFHTGQLWSPSTHWWKKKKQQTPIRNHAGEHIAVSQSKIQSIPPLWNYGFDTKSIQGQLQCGMCEISKPHHFTTRSTYLTLNCDALAKNKPSCRLIERNGKIDAHVENVVK